MKTRVIVVVVSVVLGLIATLGVATYINGIKTEVDKEAEMVPVVMATANAPIGEAVEDLVNKGVLVVKKVPKKYAVESAASSIKQISKRIVAQPIVKGEQVALVKFKDPDEVGFSYRVPDGKRAVSIEVSEVTGVSKMIIPHDHVDVLVTLKRPGTDTITKFLLQDVEVLAIGRTTVRPGEESTDNKEGDEAAQKVKIGDSPKSSGQTKTTATLAVSPSDAEKLVFGAQEGDLWLALRPGSETQKVSTPGQTISTVLQ